jgi:hypothetical protein
LSREERTEAREPETVLKRKTPKIIIRMQKILSVRVVMGMSP